MPRISSAPGRSHFTIIRWGVIVGFIAISFILNWQFADDSMAEEPPPAASTQPAAGPITGRVLGQDGKAAGDGIVCLVTRDRYGEPQGIS